MRFLAVLLFISLLVTGVAADQLLLIGAGTPKGGAGGGYSGPGDVVSGAANWWGLRCYNASKASLASAVTIRRASDNATSTIGLTAACKLDVATASTFCSATTCYVTTLYDQAGTNNMVQATAANQPQLVFNCLGTLPCMSFVGATPLLLGSASAITQASPMTASAVVWRTSTVTNNNVLAAAAGAIQLGFSAANTGYIFDGFTTSASASDGAAHAIAYILGVNKLVIDSVATTGTTNNAGFSATTVDMGGGNSAYLTGNITEAGLWAGAWTTGASSQAANICANQQAYWGTPVCGGSGYAGPGDVVASATDWWGFRCYSAAKASLLQAVNIRRASDNATRDIGLTGSCNLDVATAQTFCNATTCYVATLYDQAGTINMVQATAADQPQLVFNCLGTKPCMSFNGSAQFISTAPTALSLNSVSSGSAVAVRQGGFTAYSDIIRGRSNGYWMRYANVANTADLSGVISGAPTDSSWHAFNGVNNGASSIFGVDATQTTGTIGGAANATPLDLATYNTVELLNGSIAEAGVWGTAAFTAANITSLCHNQYAYWGTSVSC
jgi:hypothetical protein